MKIIISNFAVSWRADFGNHTRRSFESLFKNMSYVSTSVKCHANFAVVRVFPFKFVYVIFYGGHVNCTGINKLVVIDTAIYLFKCMFKCNITNFKIQAIAATTDFSIALTPDILVSVKPKIRNEDRLIIVRDFFSGIILKFGTGGTAQIFYSGKINFLGAKSYKHLIQMYVCVYKLLINK